MIKDFSVLISIYLKENPLWFREALDSVFEQTVQPAEIVLVEDGPLTPELYAIIDEYSKKYPVFNVVKNERNLGLGLALQKGVLACNNEIIARMDTDDIIPKERFEKQLKFIEKGYDVVSGWTLIFEETPSNVIAIKKRPEFHDDIVKLAKRRSPIGHPSVMFRKNAVIMAGNYQDCFLYEDYYLWVRMILSGAKFYNIQDVCYYLRTSKGQIERRGGWKYLNNELKVFFKFYKMKFYTLNDLIINSVFRIFVRLSPDFIRNCILKKIWTY